MKQAGRALRRQVEAVESRVQASSATAPAMVVLLSFADDPPDAARAFAGDLREHFREARPDLYVEVLDFTFERPRGLLPQWTPGRRWYLDLQPTIETADLRPDLRPPPPGVTRIDWNPDA